MGSIKKRYELTRSVWVERLCWQEESEPNSFVGKIIKKEKLGGFYNLHFGARLRLILP